MAWWQYGPAAIAKTEVDSLERGGPLRAGLQIGLLFFLACLLPAAGHSRPSVFETVDDEDARLLSAILAPRVELYARRSALITVCANLEDGESSSVARALAGRLRDHGFTVGSAADGESGEEIAIFVSVKQLTYGVWVRVLTGQHRLYFLFARQSQGGLELFKETRIAAR
jgi:hypothetical protein